jgi:hypothetical protein
LSDYVQLVLEGALISTLQRASVVTVPGLHIVFCLLIASGCWVTLSGARTPRLAWTAVTISSVAWLRWDRLAEGRILISFDHEHGLTQADLLVPLVVFLAAATSGLRRTLTGRGAAGRHRA